MGNAINNTLYSPTINGSIQSSVLCTQAILSSSSSAGIGYDAGSGGSVTQSTNKSTAVTINKINGLITTANSALSGGASAQFTVNNSTAEIDDIVNAYHQSGGLGGNYTITARCQSGSVIIELKNASGGSLSEAIGIKFIIIKSSNS